MIYNLWTWLGIIYLVYLTFQDFYKKMKVDSRYNFLMIGLSLGLLMVYSRPLWMILVVIGLVMGLAFFLRKIKSLGSADVKSISWIILGWSIIDYWRLLIFLGAFAVFTGVFVITKLFIMKYKGPSPFYVVILGSFLVSVLW